MQSSLEKVSLSNKANLTIGSPAAVNLNSFLDAQTGFFPLLG